MKIETGDLVVERRNRDPLRPLRQNVRHWRDERTEFRPDIAQEQDRVLEPRVVAICGAWILSNTIAESSPRFIRIGSFAGSAPTLWNRTWLSR